MEAKSHPEKSNPNTNGNTTKEKNNHCNKKKKKNHTDQFEFCKVCKLNHNKGRTHKFFPNHIKSLSAFLSRFQAKLSDVRFFLKNPTILRPEHASLNRFWCVFCELDIDELGSTFACGNAIDHLAGAEHLKNLKDFLWKYGGKMDQVDSFQISEADMSKWDKKCKLLKSEAANGGSSGSLIGPALNDIHNELNSEYIDSFDRHNIRFLNSTFSNGVLPLQSTTTEVYQVSHPEPSGVTQAPPFLHGSTAYVDVGANSWGSKVLSGYMSGQRIISNDRECSTGWSFSNGGVSEAEGTSRGEGSSHDLQKLTRISSSVEGAKGNVYSGAPPPWFTTTDGNQLGVILKPGLRSDSCLSPLSNSGKSKLNPKRVGAAWAERRKIELEMEKRGDTVINNFDTNWLPNFGRVWQSGSRKESRKEFEVENKRTIKDDSGTEKPVELQPYISKRMRRDTGE